MLSRLWSSRTALTAGAAGIGLVLLGGIALAVVRPPLPDSSAPEVRPASDLTVAEQRGGNALKEVLDKLVQNGTITADQRDKILKAVDEELASRKPRGLPHLRLDLLEEAARAIGITLEQLRQELPGKSLAQVAQAHNVSADTLKQKLVQAFNAKADKAIADKKLTAEQATKLKERFAAEVNALVDRVHDQRGRRKGPPAKLPGLSNLLQDAAQAIGIPLDQLRQELPGKSLAEVAKAHSVSRDTLVSKLVAAETARIDDAVAKGRLTADQAARSKSRLSEAIGKAVDRTTPQKKR